MAEELTVHHDFPRRYPWKQWANGSQWKLKRGEDFDVSPKSFRGAAWLHARDHNLNLQTSVVIDRDETGEVIGEYVIVQFAPKGSTDGAEA